LKEETQNQQLFLEDLLKLLADLLDQLHLENLSNLSVRLKVQSGQLALRGLLRLRLAPLAPSQRWLEALEPLRPRLGLRYT
jgi:hypothetical protein